MMKYILPSLLICIIITAVFGFVFMAQSMDGMGGNCIASLLDNSVCQDGMFALVIHHIAAFRAFSNVPVTPLFGMAISLIILFLSFVSVSSYLRKLSFSFLDLCFVRIRRDKYIDVLHQPSKFTHWLSLFELSPSF